MSIRRVSFNSSNDDREDRRYGFLYHEEEIVGYTPYPSQDYLEVGNMKEDDSVHVIKSLANLKGIEKVVVNECIDYIQDRAFKNCLALQSIIICNPDIRLGIDLFSGCVKLKEIVLCKETRHTTIDRVRGMFASISSMYREEETTIEDKVMTIRGLQNVEVVVIHREVRKDSHPLGDLFDEW